MMDETNAGARLVYFVGLGCGAVAFCKQVNNGETPEIEAGLADARRMLNEVMNGVQGNKPEEAEMSTGDLVMLVEGFIRRAYHELKLQNVT